MPEIRSNGGPRVRLLTTGLVGFVSILMAAESASAYTSAAITKANTIAAVGSTPLIRAPRDGFGEPCTESSNKMVGAGKVIELAQYGSVRRVSLATSTNSSITSSRVPRFSCR